MSGVRRFACLVARVARVLVVFVGVAVTVLVLGDKAGLK